MRIGKTKVEKRTYTMGTDKKPLRESTVEKDIGVHIDDRLSFDEHINSKVNKANSTMGLIRRSFEFLDERTFKLLYKALVRPHIEYANQVWAPTLKRQETVIENVQRRATKQIPGLKDLSYEDRLRRLGLPTLKYRRIRGDMIELYKILTHKYDKNVSDFIKLNKCNKGTRGHNLKIEKQQFRLDVRKHSFVCRSVETWNSLPAEIVNAPSIHAFEARLDRYWATEPFKYNIEEPTTTPRHRQEEKPLTQDTTGEQGDNRRAGRPAPGEPTATTTASNEEPPPEAEDGLQADIVM
jgi:hypothetical protein